MKIVALGQAKNELSAYVDEAQHDRVLITRHGKPAVLLIGVEGEDLEDLLTMANPRFWEMIEERRKNSKTVSADEMRRKFGLERAPAGKGPRARQDSEGRRSRAQGPLRTEAPKKAKRKAARRRVRR